MKKVVVIKIGGNVIDDEAKLRRFLGIFSKIETPKILVHGGGKIATRMAERLGIATQMVEGRRITDEPMREVVTMVYGGLVNKNIVGTLQTLGCNALGLSGADGLAVLAEKRPVKTIDYGLVGDVKQINTGLIISLLKQNITPVFAPLSFDPSYGLLNTNADTQASEISKALAAHFEVHLIYCFEKKGVLSDTEDENSVIPLLDPISYERLKAQGAIYAGMIPKLDTAFVAIDQGVKFVSICEADELPALLTGARLGTLIQGNKS